MWWRPSQGTGRFDKMKRQARWLRRMPGLQWAFQGSVWKQDEKNVLNVIIHCWQRGALDFLIMNGIHVRLWLMSAKTRVFLKVMFSSLLPSQVLGGGTSVHPDESTASKTPSYPSLRMDNAGMSPQPFFMLDCLEIETPIWEETRDQALSARSRRPCMVFEHHP